MDYKEDVIDKGRKYLTELQIKKQLLHDRKKNLRVELQEHYNYIKSLTLARDVVNSVFVECGMEAKEIIEAIGSLALQTIYGTNLSLVLQDNIRYNKTEFKPLLAIKTKQGEELRKLRYGGIVDIISFSFRLALWALKENQSGIFWFDEPFKWVQKDKEEDIDILLSEIKRMLNIQIILTTHSSVLAQIGDRSFEVTQENGISKVTQL